MSSLLFSRENLENLAREYGFSALGVTQAQEEPKRFRDLTAWLNEGHQADMHWMAREPEKRAHPPLLWQEVKSIIMFGMNYAPEGEVNDIFAQIAQKDQAYLAYYALRRDYHDVMKSALKALARDFIAQTQKITGETAEVKVFVDTAPVMEKPLAAAAGLGWQGKNTLLIARQGGGWLLLAALYTNVELPPDPPARNHCGTCTRCLDICPTKAFPQAYQLDSRRCLAYLSIEHHGVIPLEFRVPMGNRVFGCDDCLAICPWNKFAEASHDARMNLKTDLLQLGLASLLQLDEPSFRLQFAGTPIKRTGYARFMRNVLIAVGNSGESALVPLVKAQLSSPHALMRGMAVWALRMLMKEEDFAVLKNHFYPQENDENVRQEWE